MKVYGITDGGPVRSENQDCFRIDFQEDCQLVTAVLCDGMGGAQAGSIASALAADSFMSHASNSLDEKSTYADMQTFLADAINYANIKVYDKSYSDFSCMGMGSTLVAVSMNSKRAMVANVGDSRAYFLENSKIYQITRDHSLVEELRSRGKLTREEAQKHEKKNIITRAVGVEPSVRCDLFEIKNFRAGRILLCSDGLSNLLSDSEINSISMMNAEPEDACRKLLQLALERGAPDNVTVVIVEK